ncbi:MAG: EAL domain-containing protein [Parvibaculaceae bacterium]|nr:EAL domain-containing protein [Parvibaculaceae bacterium]
MRQNNTLEQGREAQLSARDKRGQSLFGAPPIFKSSIQPHSNTDEDFGSWYWNPRAAEGYLSPVLRETFGIDTDELEEFFVQFERVLHVDDRDEMMALVHSHHVTGVGYCTEKRIRIDAATSAYRWFRLRGFSDIDSDGVIRLVGGAIEDMTHERAVSRYIKESESRFSTMVETALFPLVITRLSDQSIQYFNSKAKEVFDVQTPPNGIHNVADFFVNQSDLGNLREELIASGKVAGQECMMQTCTGEIVWMHLSCNTLEIEGQKCASVILHDVTEQKTLEQRLRQQARMDELTSLNNRKAFYENLEVAIDMSARSEDGFALLLLDLDKFKQINDTLGHGAGDILLVETARRLEKCLRRSDVVARLGGDEFAIIAGQLKDPTRLSALAEKIVTTLSQPVLLGETEVAIGCSIGIAVHFTGQADGPELMRHADIALYKAKEDVTTSFRMFDEELSVQARERALIERELHVAVSNEEFHVVFQPRVDAHTHEIIAGEALIRWDNHRAGFVPPDKFIPIAEENGLIVEIGRQVLRATAGQIAQWAAEGLVPVPISVNMSAVHFLRADVVADVQNVLEEFSIPSSLLQIEVTESTLIHDQERVLRQIDLLVEMGCEVMLDDFGTGYSSLSFLHRFPVNTLKIDRSFVAGLMVQDQAPLAKQIVDLGLALNLRIIAEGVEMAGQADILAALGCHELQGYLFHRPSDAEVFGELLAAERPMKKNYMRY